MLSTLKSDDVNGRLMMRTITALAVALFGMAGLPAVAQALPVDSALGAAAVTDVVKAGWACGPGYHLGPNGRACWPNRRYVYARPYAYQPYGYGYGYYAQPAPYYSYGYARPYWGRPYGGFGWGYRRW
jgi:hypothetical protein